MFYWTRMKLREYEGKELFKKYGISVPKSVLLQGVHLPQDLTGGVVKAQVLSGNRFKNGGILITDTRETLESAVAALFDKKIDGEKVRQVLVEEYIPAIAEYYVSFSYSGTTKSPVLLLSLNGGTGIHASKVFPISLLQGVTDGSVRDVLLKANFPKEDISGVSEIIKNLWRLFTNEHALVAEINPLFKINDKIFIAGDAKVILDDAKANPNERQYIDMEGDIAILASGGGASMLNMDALIRAGGKPANYTEYSGNPSAEIVKELTIRVLSKPNLKGCWVVGAAANFTDIQITLSGFLEGLREITPRPAYPILVRRDGPNREKGFAMLREAGAREGFDFHLFDASTPMAATAQTMVDLAYRQKITV
jgi:succinyl-CoA synthetase beta subunit